MYVGFCVVLIVHCVDCTVILCYLADLATIK